MNEEDLRSMNTAALAYMGDAVYEQAVREKILKDGVRRTDRLHRETVRYVCAGAQAEIIRQLIDELTEDEQAIVKRSRNYKYHSKAKNADPMTYKWATAFEAFAGYLYLAGDAQRLEWLFSKAFEIIDKEDSR